MEFKVTVCDWPGFIHLPNCKLDRVTSETLHPHPSDVVTILVTFQNRRCDIPLHLINQLGGGEKEARV